jgi:lysozyme
MEFLLYISFLLVVITTLWVLVSYPKNYLFKAIFIPALILVTMSTYFTYNAILGYATNQDPPEVVRYLYHATDKDKNIIYLLLVGSKREPRLHELEWNKELEKELKAAQKGTGQGVIKFGRLHRARGTNERNKGKWLWYDMPPQEVMPKDYEGDNEMETSQNGIELIKEFEGCRQVAYQDSVGVWTIGYGHTKTAYEGQLVIKKTCERLLAEDLAEFEEYVDTLVKVPLTQNQFDALVSWTFNLGSGNLQESTMLRKLNEGDYGSVPAEMKRWNKAGGEVLKGLVRRREAEAALFKA